MRIGLISPLLAGALSACATGPGDSSVLKIERAVYSVQDGSIPCEVTTRMASLCRGLSACKVPIDSSLCPMGDPAPMEQKVLTVTYQCGAGGLHQTVVAESQAITLACKQ